VVLALGAVIPLSALSSVPEALLKKSLNFRTYAALTACAALLTALLAVGAGLAGAGAWALVVRQLAFQGFVAGFAWLATRKVLRALPRGRGRAGGGGVLRGRLAFMVLGVSVIGAMSLDNIVVGAVTDARELGFYSLAFTLGFAPLTELSWRLGQVMFPAAAATPDLAAVGERTVRVVRGTALLLLPLLPPAVVLAPRLVPALLGARWQPMVAPLQVLLPVGVLHAIVNTIGESLSGTGNIRFRAWRESVWAAGTLGAVGALTAIDGITFLPLAAVYTTAGARRIGADGRRLWTALRDVLMPVAGQAAVTVGVAHALARAAATPAAVAAAGAGLGTCVLLMRLAPSRPLREAGLILRLVLPRRLIGGGVAGRAQAAGSAG
jgi:O-antigen/teichoic acid export membrane protein